MGKLPKSRVLLIDMQLKVGAVVRKLNEGSYYWFVDIETETRNGREINRVLENHRYKKSEFPTFDNLLDHIRVTFETEPTRPNESGG